MELAHLEGNLGINFNSMIEVLIQFFFVNEFHNFFYNIRLFHNIFLCRVYKKILINLDNLIYFVKGIF